MLFDVIIELSIITVAVWAVICIVEAANEHDKEALEREIERIKSGK